MKRVQGADAAALNAVYGEGLAHHQGGRLDQARQCYEQVLAAAPRHFDALHLLGVYHVQTGRLERGVELIRQAIAIRRDQPGAFGNLANALNALGRHAEALEASNRAIALNPNFAEAHGNRGQAMHKLGRLKDALASYSKVVALKPTAKACFNQATLLRELGRLEEALDSYAQAIAADPNYVEALRSHGVTLCDLGRPQEALASFDRAIAIRPDYAEAWCGRGVALRKLGRPAEALASQDQALSLRPSYVEALCNKVAPLRELQRREEALDVAEAAISIAPDDAQAHMVRGVALYDLRRLEQALESYDRAIALDPGHAKAHNNRGLALFELRRLEEALASYGKAVALRPDFADAQYNQSLCRLMLGQSEAGWTQHEWRWRTDELRGHTRERTAPTWLGQESLAGRTILLWAEQGLGDTLQFCRYARDVAALGATVVLEVQSGLQRLAASLNGVATVIAAGEPAPPYDFQAPLMSLPHALRAHPMAGDTPYLAADPEDTAAWAARLGPRAGLRVGLCWAGGARPDQFNAESVDRRRSLPLAAFAPLASVADAVFYSLQKGPPSAQLGELQAQGWAGPKILDLTDELQDYADTAAFVANLDLVITCDTSVAHLAGALGKPVWILNRFDGCWRWLHGQTQTAWYPSARLFNQPAPGDWASVIDEVAEALAALPSNAPAAERAPA